MTMTLPGQPGRRSRTSGAIADTQAAGTRATGTQAAPVSRPTSPHQACWLCGMSQATYQLVPDGGDACPDVRWYCQDARACTERWLAGRRAPGVPGGGLVRPLASR